MLVPRMDLKIVGLDYAEELELGKQIYDALAGKKYAKIVFLKPPGKKSKPINILDEPAVPTIMFKGQKSEDAEDCVAELETLGVDVSPEYFCPLEMCGRDLGSANPSRRHPGAG